MINCVHCRKEFDSKEVGRIYGKESTVYLTGFCSAKCYTEFQMTKQTDLKNALGNPIFIGRKYGYTTDQNGVVTVVTGECIKAVRKDEYDARVTLKVISAGRAYNSKDVEQKTRQKKTVSVKPNKLFPI